MKPSVAPPQHGPHLIPSEMHAIRADVESGPGKTRLARLRYASTSSNTPRAPACCGSCSPIVRSEEHTSELQSLMRISYAVFCLKKKKKISQTLNTNYYVLNNITQQHN